MDIGASYSTVCENELLSELVPLYLVDRPISCRFWQRGVNDTYQVRNAEAIYSLRVYRHKMRSRSEVDFEISALNYLRDHGANVASPIAKREGGFVTEIQSPEGLRYVVLTTHAEGTVPDYENSDNGRLFGESVAELHNSSNGFKAQHPRSRLDIEHLLDESLNIVCPFLKDRPDDLEFLECSAGSLRQSVISVDQKDLDIGFCHGDCHGGNVHDNDGSFTHFDFDCCGYGFRVFELATFKWGIGGDDNEDELWLKFLEGYQSRREIGAEDLALVSVFVVIRHIWWMALIMGNARDFGHRATSDEFIDHQIKRIKKLLK